MSDRDARRQLTLVANIRLPSEKAHVIQIMNMASAFARVFRGVRVVYPVRSNTAAMRAVKDVFAYYGVEPGFGLVGLPCIDPVKRVTMDWKWLNFGPLALMAHAVQLLSFTFAAFLFVLRLPPGIVYSRDLFTLTVLNLLSTGRGRTFIFEVHTRPRSALAQQLHLWAARRAAGVVTISDGLRIWYLQCGMAPDRVITVRDGVALDAYLNLPEKPAARTRLGIGQNALVACYTGHFYRWKGVDTLADAAAMLLDPWEVWLVGGIEADLIRIQRKAVPGSRLHVVRHLPAPEAALYLAAADVAVLPNSAEEEISASYTSPLKLFEYMAAGKPIVASDLPAIREVVEDRMTALLVAPDDSAALARGIACLAQDAGLASRIAANAREKAREFGWNARADRIGAFIRSAA